MNMDFTNILKPTALSSIYNDIQSKSQYLADMQSYMNLGYAQGFIQAIKFCKEDEQDFIMTKFKKLSKGSEVEEYIIKLWEDK